MRHELFLLIILGAPALAQDGNFAGAAEGIQRDLETSAWRLTDLRAEIDAERLPLARQLTQLERELSAHRAEFNEVAGEVNSSAVELLRLRDANKALQDQADFISGSLLSDYLRNFDSSLLIAERARYEALLTAANAAMDNTGLGESAVFEAQMALVARSLERFEALGGGDRFKGIALDGEGLVKQGEYLLVGPTALFRAEEGESVGLIELRVNSLEPSIVPFADPAEAEAARELMRTGKGMLPFDPTLGNAARIEATKESLLEHVKKGGAVMVPIFGMAAAALLVALFKWISLLTQRSPSRRSVAALLEAVSEGDQDEALRRAAMIKGPVGRMLRVGAEHLRDPRDLLEEAMFETTLTSKLRLQRFLPFIAICAASAPLLGLLGTVTGIINTFKMITVYGSGDVKSLSGGISEALITTKFGLIVAIPSLLIHAFLSRKARGIVDEMETTALSFVNQVGRNVLAPPAPPSVGGSALGDGQGPDPNLVRAQISEILGELLGEVDGGTASSHA